jgi:hypothetical protein
MPVEPPVIVHYDNQRAIKIAPPTVTPDAQNTWDPKYHYIKNKAAVNAVPLEHTPTADMRADIFTKPLSKIKYAHAVQLVGMHTHRAAFGRL